MAGDRARRGPPAAGRPAPVGRPHPRRLPRHLGTPGRRTRTQDRPARRRRPRTPHPARDGAEIADGRGRTALDRHRPARHHVAFGYGVHQCLGQNLARAELEIALHILFDRLPTLRLAVPADEIPFKPGDTVQGMLELPVAW
ncbi:cytochrome P450 [Streptomyces coelicoflavus]|uniref:cytochrome P450 n=1 Tax=Streptomyces coelicoflavus TaxID=285562 RepID=UPI003D158213